MFCKHCGKEIDDDSTFCRFCGNELVETKNNVVTPKELWIKLISIFKNPKAKELFSFTYISFGCIIGILTYLFALTISSELLHTFGLTRGKQLNEDISTYFGIIVVIILELKLITSFIKSSDETKNQN